MNSSYSSYRHGAIHPILYFVLVQTAATSFTFSSVFILLLWKIDSPDPREIDSPGYQTPVSHVWMDFFDSQGFDS